VTSALTGVAVVTGASGGIGRATACALATKGMSVCLTGRDVGRLQDAATEIAPRAPQVLVHPADLSTDEGIRGLVERVSAEIRRIDVLVHAAGTIRLGDIELAGWDDLDEQYQVNLRAPFLLTKAFLPMLKQTRGQIVFVNSTAGFSADANNGLYAASKHALRSIAESIRDHVNPYGIRVLSIFPGRTATAMQELVHRFEGRSYAAAELVQASDVAELIVGALTLSRTAEVTEVMVRPMKKPAHGRRCG
jgi:NADP-dependent 3-hydroxy acid dehydrogenase YdfG